MKSSNGKLSIIITHRFLNIKKVNEIIVLKSGEVEAVGTHKQLLESCHTSCPKRNDITLTSILDKCIIKKTNA